MPISNKGIELIRKFEGLRLKPYYDAVGKLTIGYGHVIRKDEHFPLDEAITEEKAENLLIEDLKHVEAVIQRIVTYPLSEGQFDALASFIFNLGEGNFAKSTLLKKLNAGDLDGAAEEFLRWNRAGGRELPGLTKRRAAEQELFNA